MNENGVTPVSFAEIAAQYEAALAGWAAATERLRQAQQVARDMEKEADYREAELTLAIEGGNAEIRKAKLALALHADPGYLQWQRLANARRDEIARCQDDITAFRDRLSLYKRQMEYLIALVDYLPRPSRPRRG